MKTIRNAILYLVLICSISCTFGPSESALNERPHDPWIFRSVLDNNARIVTLALDLNLWAAYSTENAALYQAWKGAVNFDGPVYTTQHGPQPLSVGDKYVVNRFLQPWKIKSPGGDLNPTVQYKGHKVVNDQAVLMYELEHPNLSSSIKIEESVDAHTNEKNQPVFQRRFTTSSVPENHSVVLETNVYSIIVKANIATDGELTFTKEADVKAGYFEFFNSLNSSFKFAVA